MATKDKEVEELRYELEYLRKEKAEARELAVVSSGFSTDMQAPTSHHMTRWPLGCPALRGYSMCLQRSVGPNIGGFGYAVADGDREVGKGKCQN